MRLKGRIVIVTGAAGGFGSEIGRIFAHEGASLVLADINYNAAESLANELKAQGTKAVAVSVDVGDEKQVYAMVNRAMSEFGQVDILINNAGMGRGARIQDITLDDWNQLLRLNLTGTFLCCKAVIDHMIARGYGKIVNMASICGQTARPVGVDYSASKSGIIGITRTLALQVAPYGINVNAVAPGPVATQIFERNWPKETVDKLKSTIPFKREGTPRDIANAALFLSSDEAGWITGEVIAVNGGAFIG
ncbi:MAG TPA: 3-oxoacyl-ACP reductase family protein [Thermosynergistes sp.]|nr:3-oxoacyl-ACP reductase family protein [Thermosynergistes sp.]HQE20832.1 3-oxoacyl-ACP reductase family protein [Thermosynergistes sp.]